MLASLIKLFLIVNWLKMSNSIMKIKNLRKIYHTNKNEIIAVDDFSFDLMSGEFVAIVDPSFIYAGAPFLVFGSWSNGINIVRLSSGTMKPNAAAKQIATRNQSSNSIEGACIWDAGNGYFYLFASFDKCCVGTSSTYNIRYGRSQNVDGPYVDKNGVSMMNGGGTILVQSSGNMIGPGGESLFKTANGGMAIVYHFYDANNNGMATIRINDISIVDGWPAI